MTGKDEKVVDVNGIEPTTSSLRTIALPIKGTEPVCLISVARSQPAIVTSHYLTARFMIPTAPRQFAKGLGPMWGRSRVADTDQFGKVPR